MATKQENNTKPEEVTEDPKVEQPEVKTEKPAKKEKKEKAAPVDPRVPVAPVIGKEPKEDFDARTPGTPPWLDENGKQVNGAEDVPSESK